MFKHFKAIGEKCPHICRGHYAERKKGFYILIRACLKGFDSPKALDEIRRNPDLAKTVVFIKQKLDEYNTWLFTTYNHEIRKKHTRPTVDSSKIEELRALNLTVK